MAVGAAGFISRWINTKYQLSIFPPRIATGQADDKGDADCEIGCGNVVVPSPVKVKALPQLDEKETYAADNSSPKRLCGFRTVYMLKVNLMLLLVLQS